MNQLVASNPTLDVRNRSSIDVGNRTGHQFTYTFLRNGRPTTANIVVLVENQYGYTLTYLCTSFLYPHLHLLFLYMLNSFVVVDTLEDRVEKKGMDNV